MARLKIHLPASFSFTTFIPVRITDLNYGGHVGNDTVLTIIHEARMQFLRQLGYTEMQMEGTGMIMADASIEYKHELFYGDQVQVSIKAGDFSRIGFTLYYKLEKNLNGERIPVAFAQTGMICYSYDLKKIVSLPDGARKNLSL